MNTNDDTTQAITRAKCDGYTGFKAHLIDFDRLIDPKIDAHRRGNAVAYATGPCPVCGASGHVRYGEFGPADRVHYYELIDVKGTFVADKKCSAACRMSASAECKCSCGGTAHGMHA